MGEGFRNKGPQIETFPIIRFSDYKDPNKVPLLPGNTLTLKPLDPKP